MHPIIFQWGPLTIYSYGFMLFVAVCCGLFLLTRETKRLGYNPDTYLDFSMVILVSGIVGARLLFVALNVRFFIEHPLEIIMLHHGGLAILGGVVFGTLAGFIFVKRKKLSFFSVADTIIPYVALAQSIGRIGCFLNGCCYGLATRCGIYFPVHDAILVPTQLVSSLLLVLLFVVLRVQQSRPHVQGSIFASYITCYALLRFFVEYLRADSPKLLFGLSLFQYFCIPLFAAGIGLTIYLQWKNKPLA